MADAFDILHSRIAQLLGRRDRVLAAIDGMAASGKTTLCERLRSAIPGCRVVHMDDFTLPFEQRGFYVWLNHIFRAEHTVEFLR